MCSSNILNRQNTNISGGLDIIQSYLSRRNSSVRNSWVKLRIGTFHLRFRIGFSIIVRTLISELFSSENKDCPDCVKVDRHRIGFSSNSVAISRSGALFATEIWSKIIQNKFDGRLWLHSFSPCFAATLEVFVITMMLAKYLNWCTHLINLLTECRLLTAHFFAIWHNNCHGTAWKRNKVQDNGEPVVVAELLYYAILISVTGQKSVRYNMRTAVNPLKLFNIISRRLRIFSHHDNSITDGVMLSIKRLWTISICGDRQYFDYWKLLYLRSQNHIDIISISWM